ncbi:MAG: hypothetical protein A2103_02465 [Gammaproteobacteria bacterium GWF2_41_13]|nr:MAG: hypothetical protein A2103_02465 [Gammaproteobacteria bacterium GWF2_41_13]
MTADWIASSLTFLAMTNMKRKMALEELSRSRGMTTFCHSGNFVQGCAKLSGIQADVMDEGNGNFWIPRSSRGMTESGDRCYETQSKQPKE